MSTPIFIRNASQLVTLQGSSDAPRVKGEMSELGIIENGSIWIEDGVIQAVGTDVELFEKYSGRLDEAEVVDASGKLVTPGLLTHTHILYLPAAEKMSLICDFKVPPIWKS